MQFKKILLFFLVALPLSIALRLIQITYIVESATGFFLQEFEGFGNAMLAVIFAFCAAVAIFAFFSHRSPEQPVSSNIPISITAICYSFAILYELAAESFPPVVRPWQITLLNITGVATAAYFTALALKRFVNFPLPNALSLIPTVYLILRIICDFTAISSLALISDNLFLMASYAVSLLFMLNFAKLYNNAGGDYGSRKLMATGLAATIICFTQAIPHIIINFINGFQYLHTSMAANITVLFMGGFIAAYTFSHFSKKNSCQ